MAEGRGGDDRGRSPSLPGDERGEISRRDADRVQHPDVLGDRVPVAVEELAGLLVGQGRVGGSGRSPSSRRGSPPTTDRTNSFNPSSSVTVQTPDVDRQRAAGHRPGMNRLAIVALLCTSTGCFPIIRAINGDEDPDIVEVKDAAAKLLAPGCRLVVEEKDTDEAMQCNGW